MSKEQCQGAQILTSSYTLKNTKTITLRYLFFCNQSVVISWYHTSFFFFFQQILLYILALPYLFGTVPQSYQQQSREMLILQILLFVVLVAQSCPTLCDPMDCSLPGSSVHGISQARILEWVAMPFSRGSSRDGTQVSCTAGRFFTIWVSREGLFFSPCSALSPRYLAHSLLLRSSINTCWKSGKMKAPAERNARHTMPSGPRLGES